MCECVTITHIRSPASRMSELRQPRRVEYCDLDLLWNQHPIEHLKTFFPKYKLIAVKGPSYSFSQIDSVLNSPKWLLEFGKSQIIACEHKDWEQMILDIVADTTENWLVMINDTYTEFKHFRNYIQTLE
jgi:hypothetical protein